MKKKNLLLWGYYGANNFGDDLIFESLTNILNKNPEKFNLFYTLKNKKYTYKIDAEPLVFFNKRHNNKALNFLLNILFVFNTVLKMDIIIIGGGTQYFELNSRKSISIPIKYLACSLIKLRGKTFINAGVGIGKVKSKLGKFCLKRIFKKADYSFVRDINSKSFLEEIGVPESKVIIGRDLSYYLPSHNEKVTKEVPNKIGLNFFDYFNYIEKNANQNEIFINDLNSFISWLKTEKLCEPYFFAFQKDEGGKDLNFIQNNFSSINAPVYTYENNIEEFIELMSSMDINVGMRYHFAVLSIQHKIPFIGLNYQPKVKRELQSFNLGNCIIEMNETKQLKDKFNHVYNEYKTLKLRLNNPTSPSNQEQGKIIVNQLLGALNG